MKVYQSVIKNQRLIVRESGAAAPLKAAEIKDLLYGEALVQLAITPLLPTRKALFTLQTQSGRSATLFVLQMDRLLRELGGSKVDALVIELLTITKRRASTLRQAYAQKPTTRPSAIARVFEDKTQQPKALYVFDSKGRAY